jgi:hypothetical protein
MNLGARAETRRYIKIYLGFLGTAVIIGLVLRWVMQ